MTNEQIKLEKLWGSCNGESLGYWSGRVKILTGSRKWSFAFILAREELLKKANVSEERFISDVSRAILIDSYNAIQAQLEDARYHADQIGRLLELRAVQQLKNETAPVLADPLNSTYTLNI